MPRREPTQPATTWDEIERYFSSLQGGQPVINNLTYRERYVQTFENFQGRPLNTGRMPVPGRTSVAAPLLLRNGHRATVTMRRFADHWGIPVPTFQGWVREVHRVEPDEPPSGRMLELIADMEAAEARGEEWVPPQPDKRAR
jgi:hypothetical protein